MSRVVLVLGMYKRRQEPVRSLGNHGRNDGTEERVVFKVEERKNNSKRASRLTEQASKEEVRGTPPTAKGEC